MEHGASPPSPAHSSPHPAPRPCTSYARPAARLRPRPRPACDGPTLLEELRRLRRRSRSRRSCPSGSRPSRSGCTRGPRRPSPSSGTAASSRASSATISKTAAPRGWTCPRRRRPTRTRWSDSWSSRRARTGCGVPPARPPARSASGRACEPLWVGVGACVSMRARYTVLVHETMVDGLNRASKEIDS